MVRPLYFVLMLLHSLHSYWFPLDLGPIPPLSVRICFLMPGLGFYLEDGGSRDIPEFDNYKTTACYAEKLCNF
jgi:hypothetical protein